jgi:hypothetical protein
MEDTARQTERIMDSLDRQRTRGTGFDYGRFPEPPVLSALVFDRCYDRAFKMALRETGLNARPERTRWTPKQTLSADFFPEA